MKTKKKWKGKAKTKTKKRINNKKVKGREEKERKGTIPLSRSLISHGILARRVKDGYTDSAVGIDIGMK